MANNMEAVKIQINSKEALERLLGGEPELEAEVRRSVMKAFVKDGVTFFSKGEESIVKNEIKRAADEYIANGGFTFTKTQYGQRVITDLPAGIKEAIDIKTKEVVAEMIDKSVAKIVDELDIEGIIQQKVIDRAFAACQGEMRLKFSQALENLKKDW